MALTSASPATATAIHITGVSRTFGADVHALSAINLHIAPGEFVALLGPSGCGKSTLLRLIAGLDQPTTGQIERQGETGRVAFVFQDAHLLPWRNVLRNVALPLELMGIGRAERQSRARSLLHEVGLTDAERRYPAQLSGGMRMRVSLARALITHPRLLLLDEPFAALDEITRQRLDEHLRGLWNTHRFTTIFVTHSTAEAAFLADRAVVFSPRPGRVLLDTPITLPAPRDAALRGSPAFAAETRRLYQALEEGG